MYGLIGRLVAVGGTRERDELIQILLDGVPKMLGCISFVVARDLSDEKSLWVTEVWDSWESHQASLASDSVREAIARGKPLIADFNERFETVPVGGHGISI